jgi:hypothetical protein
MSGHRRVRRGKAPLHPYWRIEPPRPTLLITNPAPRRLVRMIAAGIRVTPKR